jgi:hypothetical protein
MNNQLVKDNSGIGTVITKLDSLSFSNGNIATFNVDGLLSSTSPSLLNGKDCQKLVLTSSEPNHNT